MVQIKSMGLLPKKGLTKEMIRDILKLNSESCIGNS